MGRKKEEVESEYETDSGSEYEEEESEYETDEEVPVAAPTPSKSKGQSKNKANDPCKQYRVDTTADAFGTCKCGWPKIDHDGPRANKAAEALSRLKSKRMDADDIGSGSGDGPCLNFRVDVTADKFGMCKCGHHQSEHGSKKINPARAALKSLKAVSSAPKAGHIPKGGKACQNYSVDPTAAEFGTCYCGFKKSEHGKKEEDPAAMMLRKLKEKNQKANERADMLAVGMTANSSEDDEEDSSAKDKKGNKKSSSAKAAGSADKASAKLCCVVM